MSTYNFQYCQKIVVFSNDFKSVLLCRRKGENDYDGVYSFIGGKMETTDWSLMAGLEREKNEEVGAEFTIEVYPAFSTNLLFAKKSGDMMVLPHYLARHVTGGITLSDEYSDYKWLPITELSTFEPKVPNVPDTVWKLLALKDILLEQEKIVI